MTTYRSYDTVEINGTIWERLHPKAGRKQPLPHDIISLQKCGALTISSELKDVHFPSGYICFVYNSETGEVGLKPSTSSDPNSFKLSSANNYRYLVNAKRFIKHFGLSKLLGSRLRVLRTEGDIVVVGE